MPTLPGSPCASLCPEHGMLPGTVRVPLHSSIPPTPSPGGAARLDLSLAVCLGQGGRGATEPWEPAGAQACLHEVHEVSETQTG